MEKIITRLENNGFTLKNTILYYENRPFPYTEVWTNEMKMQAILIDHGICQQPVCGATWSYRMYVEKQNQIHAQYKWLRYRSKALESLERDLAKMNSLKGRTNKKLSVDPRKVHPQLIGADRYEGLLKQQRMQALNGVFVEMVFPL